MVDVRPAHELVLAAGDQGRRRRSCWLYPAIAVVLAGALASVPRVTAPARRHLQMALGVLWLLDAVLECQPAMFHADFFGNMLMMSMSAPPAWLWNLITNIEPTVVAHAAPANSVAVVIQFAIGLGLLWRPTVRPALALSIPWALTVWLFGEMAGGLFVEGGSALTGAPGAALVYAVLAVVLCPAGLTTGSPPQTEACYPARCLCSYG